MEHESDYLPTQKHLMCSEILCWMVDQWLDQFHQIQSMSFEASYWGFNNDICQGLEKIEDAINNLRKTEVDNSIFRCNNVVQSKKLYALSCDLSYLDEILNIDVNLWGAIEILYGVDFPARLEWKVTNPGEQMTGTFHRIVLDDNKKWYESKYYN